MKKKIIIISILFIACSSYMPKYIVGYVCNAKKVPLKGIFLVDPDDKNVYSFTDKNGYFKINKMINGRYLRVFYEGVKIDSIYIVRTHPEKGVSYNFVDGKKDTLFVNIKQ